jgi:hypothetical protein
MHAATSNGGLIGSVKSAIDGVFAKPEAWLIRCAILASVISVIYYSGDKAKDIPTQAILVLLGLAAVGFHYVGAQKACRAWFERQIGSFACWSLIICGAVAWEVNSTISVASQNQSNLTNAQLTAFTKSDNSSKAVADGEAKVARLREERNLMKPKQAPGAARAVISNAKANRWWGTTKACTETKGPKTREFCDGYFSAEADLALWDQIAKQEIALGGAEQDLADARRAVMQAPVLASADRADLGNLRRLTGMSLEDLELSQSLLTVFVLALFLTIAGWLVKAEEYEGKPRKPWFGRLMARLTGKPTPEQPRAMTETHQAINAVMNPSPKMTHKTLLDLARERGMTFSGAAA